jgi:hypothetical protein
MDAIAGYPFDLRSAGGGGTSRATQYLDDGRAFAQPAIRRPGSDYEAPFEVGLWWASLGRLEAWHFRR